MSMSMIPDHPNSCCARPETWLGEPYKRRSRAEQPNLREGGEDDESFASDLSLVIMQSSQSKQNAQFPKTCSCPLGL